MLNTNMNELIKKFRGALSSNEARLALLALLELTRLLGRSGIKDWLNESTPADFLVNLTDRLKQLGERGDLNLEQQIKGLSFDQIRSAFGDILMLKLPNPEIALNLLQQGHQVLGEHSLPSELADLMAQLMVKKPLTEFMAQISSADSKEAKPYLCVGSQLHSAVLFAAAKHAIKFEVYGVGTGHSIRKAINDVSGLPITMPRLDSPLSVLTDEQKYDGGLLVNTWGKPILKSTTTPLPYTTDLAHLKEMANRVKGRIVCLVPQGFMFKTFGGDLDFKTKLFDQELVEAVIKLPVKTLNSIGTNISLSLLVLNTSDRPDSTKFIDASSDQFYKKLGSSGKLVNTDKIVSLLNDVETSELSAVVSLSEIAKNTYNLDVKRYIQTDDDLQIAQFLSRFNTQPLGELVTMVRCQNIGSPVSEDNPEDEDGLLMVAKEIGPSNIDEYGVLKTQNYKKIIVDPKHLSKITNLMLQPNDIIIAGKGSVGKCSIFTKSLKRYIANQSCYVLRLRPNSPIDALALFHYLASNTAQTLLKRNVSGAVIPLIKKQDLVDLPVPIFSEKQQQDIKRENEKISELLERKQQLETEIRAKLEACRSFSGQIEGA